MEQKTNNWMEEEYDSLDTSNFDGERKPSLRLEENKTIEVEIDFSKPFDKWNDIENKTVKKIIPVKVGEVELVWWLNVKNPVYAKLIKLGMEGKNIVKILTIGKGKSTKYEIVE